MIQWRERVLATALTLSAGALQHLAVFLLTHALTALLYKRSHNAATLADRCNGPTLGDPDSFGLRLREHGED